MLGRSAIKSSSRLMKSDRLIPARAARALSVLCTWSETFLICNILEHAFSIRYVRNVCNQTLTQIDVKGFLIVTELTR